ncbi:MAG TPA: hypothetical protein VFQ15_01045 [Jiangellaceae bacterium]|nr:hypothetical protein [Jiangellaceae bacterium]
MSDETTAPATRRDVWFATTLAIACAGLPAPTTVTFNTHADYGCWVEIELDNHPAADLWGAWASATRLGDVTYASSGRTKREFRIDRDGWVWHIVAYARVPVAEAPSELSEQVIAAIVDASPELAATAGAGA